MNDKTTATPTKRLNLELDEDTFRRVKAECALESMSMSQLVRKLLVKWLEVGQKKGKEKADKAALGERIDEGRAGWRI